MDEEQEKNNKKGVKNYKISYKLCNDTVLLENQDIKKEMSKILKNKDNLKSVINSFYLNFFYQYYFEKYNYSNFRFEKNNCYKCYYYLLQNSF